jgi:hypothetical protein
VLNQWQDFLSEMTDDTLAALVREPELGTLNFSVAVEKLRVIRDLVSALSVENEEELPATLVQEVGQHLEPLKAVIEEMQAFTLAQDQSSTQHQNLETRLEQERQWFVATVRPQLRGPVVDAAAKVAEITEAHDRTMAAAPRRRSSSLRFALRQARQEPTSSPLTTRTKQGATRTRQITSSKRRSRSWWQPRSSCTSGSFSSRSPSLQPTVPTCGGRSSFET